MLLNELGLPEKKVKQFNKKNIFSTDDLIYNFPIKYYDYRYAKSLDTANDGERCIMICSIVDIKRKSSYVEIIGREYKTFKRISIRWFNQPYKYDELKNLYELDVAVGGIFQNNNWGAMFINPDVFTTDIPSVFKLHSVYSQITGMSNEYYTNVLNEIMKNYSAQDILSDDFKSKFGLISEDEMIKIYHSPESIDDIKKANKKQIYNRLYSIARKMVCDTEGIEKRSSFYPRILTNTNKLIQDLPYSLTSDQRKVVKEFVESAQKGKRVNALVQGDVGYGKTVCIFLVMFAMADNGYQSVLMAPTGILARQHYKELSSYAEKYGYKTAYLGGELKVKEKREVLSKIKNGEVSFVVGTHSVISDNVEFNNLALTVVDEEHKFGVIQRESLRKKASEGVHSITMSATPIPRSLALCLYGDAMDIHTISSRPAGRLDVKTAVVNNDNDVFSFMQTEIEKGHQCYIVCPLIENNPNNEGELPVSVNEIYDKVNNYFLLHNSDIKASVVTGKMKDDEKSEIIDSFIKNKTQILIATTIIEVGVNVPNATVIAIMNAERFGLAGLHQLRGRVGRSNLQSYCILKSNELNNERLAVMCSTTDGFEIAKEDLRIRGTGDLLGVRQSGDDENVKLMLKYPVIYNEIKDYIKENEVCVNESLKL